MKRLYPAPVATDLTRTYAGKRAIRPDAERWIFRVQARSSLSIFNC